MNRSKYIRGIRELFNQDSDDRDCEVKEDSELYEPILLRWGDSLYCSHGKRRKPAYERNNEILNEEFLDYLLRSLED